MLLFNRTIDVNVGFGGGIGRRFTDLRVEFSVERSTRRSPNACSVSIYNVDPVSRGFIESANRISVRAGYGLIPSLIFAGDIAKRGIATERNGPDTITTIEGGDGELAFGETRFDWHYGPGTLNTTILPVILASMGYGLAPGAPLIPIVYSAGVTLFGMGREALDRLTSDVSMTWSVQDGNVQLLFGNSARTEPAILLTPLTGLIGAPVRTDKGISAASLLQPQLIPGRLVSIISETITGFYTVKDVKHHGDTHGNEWVTEFEAREISP